MLAMTTQIMIAGEALWSDGINAYDEAQFRLYLRLLDAVEANASNTEICKILFGIYAEREPARAKKCLESHLLVTSQRSPGRHCSWAHQGITVRQIGRAPPRSAHETTRKRRRR